MAKKCGSKLRGRLKKKYNDGGVLDVNSVFASDPAYQKQVGKVDAITGGIEAGIDLASQVALMAATGGAGAGIGQAAQVAGTEVPQPNPSNSTSTSANTNVETPSMAMDFAKQGPLKMALGLIGNHFKNQAKQDSINKFFNSQYNNTSSIIAALGAELNNSSNLNLDEMIKYEGADHEQGGIDIDDRGVPSYGETDKEVEGGEVVTSYTDTTGKKIRGIFSKRLTV